MTNYTITARIGRYIALPVVSAGIIGGAALGMAGMANAATSTQPIGPGHSYSTDVHAQPAPNAVPGHRWHTGMHHLAVLQPTTVK